MPRVTKPSIFQHILSPGQALFRPDSQNGQKGGGCGFYRSHKRTRGSMVVRLPARCLFGQTCTTFELWPAGEYTRVETKKITPTTPSLNR